MNKQYMAHKEPLDIKPAADRNVERINDCCLDVRPKSSYLFGRGRGGGAWWMIWMIFFVIVGCGIIVAFILYKKDFHLSNSVLQKAILDQLLFVIIPSTLFFGLSLFWPIHIWKNHLPLRFNRKTRKVYFHWKGKTYVEDWDELKVNLKAQFGMNAMGAPIRDPHINIEFHNNDGSAFTVILMGVDHTDLTTEQRAAAFWEFIRRYMEDGTEHLPTPDDSHEFREDAMKELREMYKLFPLYEKDASFLTKLFGILLVLPIITIWSAISYPTEILYYHLEKRIKTNPFPPEMEAACCKQAVSTDTTKVEPDGVRVNLL